MRIALSPYHLTTREPAAMAALLLAEHAVTLLPVPAEGVTPESVRAAAALHPRYHRLLESWRWTIPLWDAGVIRSLEGSDDAAADVRSAGERLTNEGTWDRLRPLLHPGLFASPDERAEATLYLDLFSADLLKGGPDPGITIPVGLGMDAFASRHGLVAVRAGCASNGGAGNGGRRGTVGGHQRPHAASGSVAQRAEERLSAAAFSFAMPVFTQASGATIVAARGELETELRTLRTEISAHAAAGASATGSTRLREASRRYAAAFEAFAADLVGHDDEERQRVLAGYVRVTGRRLPVDATGISALAALRNLTGDGGAAAVRAMEMTPATVFTLVVEAMTLAPEAAAEAGANGRHSTPRASGARS